MTQRLWLIGGTQESRWLVETWLQKGPFRVPLLISVTTEAARRLYPEAGAIAVWVGHLTPAQGDSFIQEHRIGAILDASHPFATEISQLAIALARRHGLPYLRYEREAVSDRPTPDWLDAQGRPGNIIVPTLAQVLTADYLGGERTLLTLGYRHLPQFAPWQDRARLFARLLPSLPALETALAAGFTPARLIALRPPISAALETALWQQWGITQVITKASGPAGGEDQKQAIAAALGVRLIRLARPQLAYPQQTQDLHSALAFACQVLEEGG